VNDCSTDNSYLILEEYAKKDDRIKIKTQKVNKGQGVVRNIALDMATGEYLAFVDPDDWVELDFCEKTYETAKEYNAEIVHFDYMEHEEHQNKIIEKSSAVKINGKGLDIKPYKPYNFKDLENFCIGQTTEFTCLKIFKTNFIKQNKIKFPEIRRSEDKPFNIEARLLANTIVYIDTPFYHFRKHRKKYFIKNEYFSEMIRDLKRIIYKKNIPEKFEKNFYNDYVYGITRNQCIGRNYHDRHDLLKEAKDFLPYNTFIELRKEILLFEISECLRWIMSFKNDYENGVKKKIFKFFGYSIVISKKHLETLVGVERERERERVISLTAYKLQKVA
jgi:glycosyltransferase involved in cell wall biosynthesis